MYLAERRLERISRRLESLEQELVIQRVLSTHGDNHLSNRTDQSDRLDTFRHSRIARDGLAVGTQAPPFSLPQIDRPDNVELSSFLGRPVLILFSDPTCSPCANLWPQLLNVAKESPHLQLVLVARGHPDLIKDKFSAGLQNVTVLAQEHWEVSRAYATFKLPSAYHVDSRGLIASKVTTGIADILALAAEVATARALATA